ncbi:MAG: DUF2254 domain-containing protein [Casimicrobiaceae bacterium]
MAAARSPPMVATRPERSVMKAKILQFWDRLRSSFWFVPALMTGASVLLALGAVSIDEAMSSDWIQASRWTYTGGADGASLVLSTIAGSMITIAGVVFSMTLVALSLASSQLGPRLLRNFMRDTINQMVLGTFVATFVYCLLVLRTIRRPEEIAFIPHLAVGVGVLFGLASLGVLIYFIHHVAVSIQADEIVARVGTELVEEIDHHFPESTERAKAAVAPSLAALPDGYHLGARPIGAARDGYVQVVDLDALMKLAVEGDMVFRLERMPGQYVVMGRPVAMVWPGNRITDLLANEIRSAVAVGNHRTAPRDYKLAVHQLVEIAVRALSPGINDPFTAIACIDRLGSALCRLAPREMPSPHHVDTQGRLRLIHVSPTFSGIVNAAFNQIRQHSRSNAAVSIHMLDTIAMIAGTCLRAEDRASLRRQADMIARGAREALPEAEDRRTLGERYQAARRVLRHTGNPDR